MQKRGSIWISKNSTIVISKLFLYVFEIFLVVSVYFFFSAQLSGIKNDVTPEEIYLSRDLAFLIDAIYTAPGIINYKYSHDEPILERFIFDFKDQKVDVSSEDIRQNYPYSENKKIPLNQIRITSPSSITFEKNNENLNIKE